MKLNWTEGRVFVGLVSFCKDGDMKEILPPEAEGAVGYQAGLASSPEQFQLMLQADLASIGLRLVEVENIEEVEAIEDIYDIDEHLGQNVEAWETGKTTVWGTIHVYLDDGEA